MKIWGRGFVDGQLLTVFAAFGNNIRPRRRIVSPICWLFCTSIYDVFTSRRLMFTLKTSYTFPSEEDCIITSHRDKKGVCVPSCLVGFFLWRSAVCNILRQGRFPVVMAEKEQKNNTRESNMVPHRSTTVDYRQILLYEISLAVDTERFYYFYIGFLFVAPTYLTWIFPNRTSMW